jgi:hypothetical protein
MVYAFDTLGYAKRLRDSGVPQPQAEAHAEAARDFVMAELVTKTDLQTNLQVLSAHFDARLANFDVNLANFDAKLANMDAKLDTLSLRLTVRLGAMLVVAVGLLATVIKLVP